MQIDLLLLSPVGLEPLLTEKSEGLDVINPGGTGGGETAL